MSLYVAVPALIGIAIIGWAAGMLTFKRSMTWCTECGENLTCLRCARRIIGTSRNAGPQHTSVSGS